MRPNRVIAVVLAGLLLAVGYAGFVVLRALKGYAELTDPGRRPERLRPEELAALKRFRGYPVYWLGPRYRGLEVTQVSSSEGFRRQQTVSYGEPAVTDPGSSGWEFSLSVTTSTAPDMPKSEYRQFRRRRIRGVPSYDCAGCEELELFTGKLRVVLTGDALRQAARALRPINGPGSSRADLPRPTVTVPEMKRRRKPDR